MTSGPLAVRDDLFGFVQAFLTPRQGVDDNTNPKPPQAEPQNAAPGPQSTTGGTGPGGMAPAGAAAPLPSGTRVIPEGSVGPALPPVTADDAAMLTQSDAYKMWRAQQDQLRLKAQEDYGWDTAMSGLAGMASGLSGGSFAAGQAGFGGMAKPGSSTATGSDAMSLEQFREFSADAAKAKAAAAAKAAAYAFAQAHGIPKADIDAMVAAGDYSKLRELGFNITDPKAAGEGQLKTLEAKRATEFDAVMKDPALVGRLMQATGTDDPAVLRTLYLAGKLDTVLEKAAQGGPDYAEYMKAYPGGIDPATGKPFTYADYLSRKQTAASPTGGMAKTFGEGIVKTALEAMQKGDEGIAQLPGLAQNYTDLRDGKGYVGGILGNKNLLGTGLNVPEVLGAIKGLNIPGLNLEGVTDSQVIANRTAAAVLSRAKTLGSNPTDTDRKYIEAFMGGDLSNSREALIAITRQNMRNAVQEQINANQALRELLPTMQDPNIRQLMQSKIRDVPDYTNVLFEPEHAANIEAGIAAGSPPEKMRAAIDKQYGPGMYEYYMAKRHPAGG